MYLRFMELLDKIDKLKSLVIEYNQSVEYYGNKYHLIKIGDRDYLYNIKDGSLLVCSFPSIVKSYIRIRNIKQEDIFLN